MHRRFIAGVRSGRATRARFSPGLGAARPVGAALAVSLLAASAPVEAGHAVFHIFAPGVEAGAWGAEALSTFQSGFPDDDGASHAHEDGGHAPLAAAHEFAIHGGLTDFWMAKVALAAEREDGGDYALSSVALENVFRLPNARSTGAFDAAWFTALSAGVDSGATNAIEFGPVLSLASGPVTLTLNPFLEKTFGHNREDGIAFTYGWRATYEIAERLSIGLEGYGEIENVANAPAARDQIHRFGPVIYLGHVHGGARSHAHGDHVAETGTGHGAQSLPEAQDTPGSDWHAEIGILFGMTHATPDTAVKLNIGTDF
ncbi:MAG: hypothetical protein ABL907_26050 [Hyphomicrobium sp.]